MHPAVCRLRCVLQQAGGGKDPTARWGCSGPERLSNFSEGSQLRSDDVPGGQVCPTPAWDSALLGAGAQSGFVQDLVDSPT